ncbi:hypothetical protein [Streptomyces sp. 8L]|uniref:hypothetical protein n=1 Tax=Streptomyces sp. 8L TaxID=2877242 RepID=UPI001CD7CA23|nr:hypothetical protein [Streptomyces sp. 8L]MCA1220798.1 hypothetical protein [Streptomyces sp. 8L]
MTIVFDEVEGWGEDTWESDVTGVAVDSRDRVYALRRGGGDLVTVLEPDGTVADRWGHACLSERPHLLSIDREDTIHIADDGGHQVHVFDLRGRLLDTIGSGTPSDTGFDVTAPPGTEAAYDSIRGGPPFNRPTKAVASPSGELFVSDGYRNCRVHRFSADHELARSWGGPGADPGCFVVPHSLTLDAEGRVLVCDRENDRIQVFSRDGELLDVWNDVQRPTDIAFDTDGRLYVAELARGPRDLASWRLGRAEEELPGQVRVWDRDRTVVARIGPPTVEFLAPHAVAVDSVGALYVSEVPDSFANFTGRPHRKHRCLHKFVPRTPHS